MTRPPLELLELWAVWRAECDEVRRLHAENADSSEVQARMSAAYGALFAVPADEIRAASADLRAQAEADGVWLICWEPSDPYDSGGVEDGAWRTKAEAEIVRAQLEAKEKTKWFPGTGLTKYTLEFRPFLPAQADAGGEG